MIKRILLVSIVSFFISCHKNLENEKYIKLIETNKIIDDDLKKTYAVVLLHQNMCETCRTYIINKVIEINSNKIKLVILTDTKKEFTLSYNKINNKYSCIKNVTYNNIEFRFPAYPILLYKNKENIFLYKFKNNNLENIIDVLLKVSNKL